MRRHGQKKVDYLSRACPQGSLYSDANSKLTLDVIEIREESSDPQDHQSETSTEDPSWLPSDRSSLEDNRKRNATGREGRLRTHQPAKRVRCRNTRAPRFGRSESESGISSHDQMQGEYGDSMPSSIVYKTIASIEPVQERASAASVAANLLQNGIDLPMIRATTEASDGGVTAQVVPDCNSTTDQFRPASASLDDEVERFLMLLHRQHKYPPLHADIVSAFDSISELIRCAVDDFIKTTGFHSVSTNSLHSKALDLCRVLVGGDEPDDVRTRTATVSSQAIVTTRNWIEACAFANILQSVFLRFDPSPPAAVQEWICPFLSHMSEGRRPCTSILTGARRSADNVE